MATFKSAYDRDDLGLVVDVREPEEFAGGHFRAPSTCRAA